VPTPKEYREYADECLGWAKTAKSEREREIFLKMVQTWLEAAFRAEGKETESRLDSHRPECQRSDRLKPGARFDDGRLEVKSDYLVRSCSQASTISALS